MKSMLWVFVVFFMMIFVAPLLLFMIAFVRTEIPLSQVALCWLPVSIATSLAISYAYSRRIQKTPERETG